MKFHYLLFFVLTIGFASCKQEEKVHHYIKFNKTEDLYQFLKWSP
ncbi:MAG: glycerophosphodiester phosphodiesterase, partial [Pedobacter sp.]